MYTLGFVCGIAVYAVPAGVILYLLFIRPKRQLQKQLREIDAEHVRSGVKWGAY